MKSILEHEELTDELKGELTAVFDFLFKGRRLTYKLQSFRLCRTNGGISVLSYDEQNDGWRYLVKGDEASAFISEELYSFKSKFREWFLEYVDDLPEEYFERKASESNGVKGLKIYKYPLVLDKLSQICQSVHCGFDRYKYRYFWEERRFGYKNGNVFYYKGSRKVEMRLGKGIQKVAKLLDINVTEADVKTITNRIKAASTPCDLEVVKGSDITKYYSEDNHFPNADLGSLSASCMRYNSLSSCFKVYEEYAEGMLILKNPITGQIKGRAILWEASCGTKIMDRVYSSESDYELFFKWASDNKYTRKRYQSYREKEKWVTPDGNEFYESYDIDVSEDFLEEFGRFPYMDTFARFNPNRDVLTTRTESEDIAEFRSTSGGFGRIN